MAEITFNDLPKAVELLIRDISFIKEFILQKNEAQQQKEWLDLNELLNYLPEKPAKATAYSWVHNSIIPYHKRGKKLFFLKSEIDSWLQQGRKNTLAEIVSQSGTKLLVSNKNRKGVTV